MKGLRHQLFEALQTMGVVGETEFAEEDKQQRSIRDRERSRSCCVTQRRDGRHTNTHVCSMFPELPHTADPVKCRGASPSFGTIALSEAPCWDSADLPDLREAVQGSFGHIDGVIQGDHVRFVVDPQHRGRDVLGQIALQHRHGGLNPRLMKEEVPPNVAEHRGGAEGGSGGRRGVPLRLLATDYLWSPRRPR